MAIPNGLRQLADAFFDANAQNFDLTEANGCGKYMEAFVPHAQTHGYPKVGHLKKSGGATQYNSHAIDSFLYNEKVEPSGLLQSVDIIANAESKPPYNPNHQPPAKGWSVDAPRYTEADWMESVEDNNGNDENTVPWQPYWGDTASSEITRTIFFDYSRRPESANVGMGSWISRMTHSAFFGPEGVPLGVNGALTRHRPELCAALGGLDPNVPVPASFQGICEGIWR